MAEVSTFPTRAGDINLGATSATHEDNFQLFLKKFAGEVLRTYQERQTARGLHRVKTLMKGKSWQFPVTGQASASFHVPGESLIQSDDGAGTPGPKYLSEIPNNERLILIDHVRQASVFIPDLDEAVNHWDHRSIYSNELGEALATKSDRTWYQVAALTARESATITGGNGGDQITKAIDAAATASDRAGLYVDAAYEAAQNFDEKDVPKMGRFFVIPPSVYYTLIKEKSDFLIDKDLTTGNGDTARARLKYIADMQIVVTNHLPNAVVSAETGERNTYSGDFSNTRALAFQREAFGTVQLRGISMEAERLIEYQGTLIVAKTLFGSAPLRPECACEILTS